MDNLFVGCALSDVNQADIINGLRVPERLADYAKHFQQHVGTSDFSFELQPEDAWTLPVRYPDQYTERANNRWWRTFRNNETLLTLFRETCAPIGVHQPVQGYDLLSSNFYDKYHAIAETQRAMAFAQFIHADYFVFHLATMDKWGWNRQDQINKALKLLGVFAAFYHASDFDFVPSIELLPYPRFPATGGEAAALLRKAREIWPEVQLAFDISHLWGSRQRMIAAHEWKAKDDGEPVSFIEALEYGLEQTWEDTWVYQLGGCWESEMHAIPGLHPQEDPFHYTMKLRESAGVYAEAGEVNLNRALDLLLEYTLRRGRPLNLILEIYNRDIEQVLEAARQIRDELNQRAEKPPQEVLPPAQEPPGQEPPVPSNGDEPPEDGEEPDEPLAAD